MRQKNNILFQKQYWFWIVGCCVVLFSLIVRIIGLGSESAWIDEAYSISLSRYPIAQILAGTATDQHPPLYYLLLHFWILLGNSITNARLLSAIIGAINIFLVLIIGRKIAGKWLGIGTAFLVAISPFHVWYSQEARQYILLACLTTAASLVLWDCLQGKNRWWLYCLTVILAIYTQYFAVFIFIAHLLIVVLWSIKQKNWHLLIWWMISVFFSFVFFTPWIRTAINQFINHTMPWISEPGPGNVRDVLLRLIVGDSVLILPTIVRWIGLLIIFIVGGWLVYKYLPRDQESLNGFSFIAFWAIIPFLMISLVSFFYPVFQYKQYIIVLVPMLLLVTWVMLIIPRPWGAICFTGLALLLGLNLGYQQVVLTKDDWRGVTTYIENHTQQGDLVYGNPAASALALGLYSSTPLQFSGYPLNYDILTGGWNGQPVTPEIANNQLQVATSDYKRVWLVEMFPQFWDNSGLIPAWLGNHGKLLENKFFGNIHLRLYALDH